MTNFPTDVINQNG
jgi:hypothetical protein